MKITNLILALSFGLFANSAFAAGPDPIDPNSADLTIEPFQTTLQSSNFDVSRFVVGFDCERADLTDFNDYIHFIQLTVTKISDGVYQVTHPTKDVYHVPANSGLCGVDFRAYESVPQMTASADTMIYASALSATELSTKNITQDILTRLKTSSIVGEKFQDYPYIDGHMVHTDDPSEGFCLRVVGRSYKDPFPGSMWDTLNFGEIMSIGHQLTGRISMVGGKGSGGLMYTCNEAERSMTVSLNDPAETTMIIGGPGPNTYKATFSDDLSQMSMDGAIWPAAQ